jgi:hypothetical protein
MADRRGSRFVLEVLFLLALAVALTLAKLDPLEIAGAMLLGWVIVAGLEWAAWRDQPHFGSGLPPRYYVPRVNLPPALPLEQVSSGYPEVQRDEAPTWIASAALRAEMLGEWPVAAPVAEEPEPELDVEQPVEEIDRWTVAELPPEPEPAPEPEPEPEPAVAELEPEPVAELELEPEPEPSLEVELQRSAAGVARYSLDPLGDPAPRRRFGRGGAPEAPAVDVPARPEGVRALPGRSGSQD